MNEVSSDLPDVLARPVYRWWKFAPGPPWLMVGFATVADALAAAAFAPDMPEGVDTFHIANAGQGKVTIIADAPDGPFWLVAR